MIINDRNFKVDKNIIKKCLEVTPATVGHYIDNVMDCEIKPIHEGVKIAGPAITVRCPIIDSMVDSTVVHYVMKFVQPGDIIVINCCGDLEHASVGEIVALMAKLKKAGGIIVDGAITDKIAIYNMGLPVFAKNVSALSTRLLGISGEINTSIQCGRVTVNPGDIIFGDDDGVVVFPADKADEILEKAKQSEMREVKLRNKLLKGELLADLTGATELVERNLQKNK